MSGRMAQSWACCVGVLLSIVALRSTLAGIHLQPDAAPAQRCGELPTTLDHRDCTLRRKHLAARAQLTGGSPQLRLRGAGGQEDHTILPAPGLVQGDGELRKCTHCSAQEDTKTLALCLVTDLYFCRGGDCRRDHWRANKDIWREAMQQRATPKTTHSGIPFPVRSTTGPAPPRTPAAPPAG